MLKEGTQVGAYTVEAPMRGWPSGSYRARHSEDGTDHAVRVVHAGGKLTRETQKRFVDEARFLSRLRHPAVVPVTDVVCEAELAALVLEPVEGQRLVEVLAERALSPRSAADIALQVLSGLGHAEQAGAFHRQVDPSCILLLEPSPGHVPFVKLLDVGISKVVNTIEPTTGFSPATLPYRSPEQLDSGAEIDERALVFTIGTMLFEMVARVRPFQGSHDAETIRRLTEGDRPDVPPAAGPLGSIIERALKTDPAERHPSLTSLADALTPVASPTVAARVEAWVGAGSLVADDRAAETDALLPSGPDAELTRRLGLLQLASGTLNLTVLAGIQCFGASIVPPSLCLASILVVVGLAEVASGLRAVLLRDPGWLKATAWLEIFSILGLGVISSVVGGIVLAVTRRTRLTG